MAAKNGFRPDIYITYSAAFNWWICKDLHSKQLTDPALNDIPSTYPENTLQKRNFIRSIVTVELREQYAQFLSDYSSLQWHSEYVCIMVVWWIKVLRSHYDPLIITTSRTDDYCLLAISTLYELTRFFLFQHNDTIEEYNTMVMKRKDSESLLSSIAFKLLDTFILQVPDFIDHSYVLNLKQIYDIWELSDTDFTHFLGYCKTNIKPPIEFPDYPLIRFAYNHTYDMIYRQLYEYNSILFDYDTTYPSRELIFSDLQPTIDYLQENSWNIIKHLKQLLWYWIQRPKWYIDFYMIANTKIFLWLRSPPTICTYIKDRKEIALTIIHELLHNVYDYNSATYKKVTKSLAEKFALKESHSITHIMVYPVLDEICKYREAFSQYQWERWKHPKFVELSLTIKTHGHEKILQAIFNEWKKTTSA